jgi:uncharacterized lipoprotein YddW (UPF0748 family)
MSSKKQGCGCANIPISVILIFLGGSYWLFTKYGVPDTKFNFLLSKIKREETTPAITPTPNLPASPIVKNPQKPKNNNLPDTPVVPSATTNNNYQTKKIPSSPTENKPVKSSENKPKIQPNQAIDRWKQKEIRGIYLSRYQITNNASEAIIRERVRYYHSQGINTIIHGVWGNACTMYNSEVMQQKLGFQSCPNLFEEQWLNWLIDEAHKQGMEVHAYFEKGIKIDRNSPIFDLAVEKKWLVPGIDKTYSGIDHYVLDVENSEVAQLFQNILVEFVQKYPNIDAVQWDDYLGYHAELPGKVDRTETLTKFVREAIAKMKQVNPNVSFDICHHNPYWAKRYFAADWQKWGVDRVFIQAYNESGFVKELNYAKKHNGVAITDRQFHRLPQLLDNQAIKSILVFPLTGQPEITASELKALTQK